MSITSDNMNLTLENGFKEGMILLATLIIMLIITIMGAGLLFTSQVELTTTSTYRQNLVAHNNADALARLAIRVADVIVYGTADDVKDELDYSASDNFFLEVDNDSLNTLNADASVSRLSVKERYLRVGSSSKPDVTVYQKIGNTKGPVIGTISLSHDLNTAGAAGGGDSTIGGSAGSSDKGSSGANIVSLQNYVITVSGRDPVYKAQSFFDDDAVSGPQTFITILYSVVTTR
ncbi:MAG: hypothetical protein LBU69_00495 [Deltaproteobacteria bacterium]|nr:hypothetical protein [Deltaproteobacteria bacterium]